MAAPFTRCPPSAGYEVNAECQSNHGARPAQLVEAEEIREIKFRQRAVIYVAIDLLLLQNESPYFPFSPSFVFRHHFGGHQLPSFQSGAGEGAGGHTVNYMVLTLGLALTQGPEWLSEQGVEKYIFPQMFAAWSLKVTSLFRLW